MSNPETATPEATAVKAVIDFIKMVPAIWSLFLANKYSLTLKEGDQAGEKFLRHLESLLPKEAQK